MKTVLLGLTTHTMPTMSAHTSAKANAIVKAIHASKPHYDYLDTIAIDLEVKQAIQEIEIKRLTRNTAR